MGSETKVGGKFIFNGVTYIVQAERGCFDCVFWVKSFKGCRVDSRLKTLEPCDGRSRSDHMSVIFKKSE